MSESKSEYDVYSGLLSGSQVHTLSSDVLLNCVLNKSLGALSESEEILVLHDPCDLRKPYSRAMESIDKVRSLDHQIIQGYKSINSVAVLPHSKEVHLLAHQLYSSKEEHYLSESELEVPQSLSASEKDLIYNAQYINSNLLMKQQLKECSLALKKDHPKRSVCHILDREFDCSSLFSYLHKELEDDFIIRLKTSRLSNTLKATKTPQGKLSQKQSYVKLADKTLEYFSNYKVQKLTLNNRVYQDVTVKMEWEPLHLENTCYTVLKITLFQKGSPLFEQGMLLLTTHPIKNLEDAKKIYTSYLLRFKIEVVFKFLKQHLGWESFQSRSLETIRNLVALAFFFVGFFKELEDELRTHPLALFLCNLACSKGKITPFFLLKGLSKIAHFYEIKQLIQEQNISEEELEEFYKSYLL